MLTIVPLTTVEEALAVCRLRNTVRLMMTNDQREISADQQLHWFRASYLAQDPISYRIWLAKHRQSLLGYLAAKEKPDGIYITEAVSDQYRGQGVASELLSYFLNSILEDNQVAIAEIFTHNLPSIRLHQKWGFIEEGKKADILRYVFHKRSSLAIERRKTSDHNSQNA